jgi:hypothetical protein
MCGALAEWNARSIGCLPDRDSVSFTDAPASFDDHLAGCSLTVLADGGEGEHFPRVSLLRRRAYTSVKRASPSARLKVWLRPRPAYASNRFLEAVWYTLTYDEIVGARDYTSPRFAGGDARLGRRRALHGDRDSATLASCRARTRSAFHACRSS